MLVFIDESGHPRPTDSATRPVILAACIREADTARLTRAVFALRRTLLSQMNLTKEEKEGKGVAFLNRRSLGTITAKREYVDSVFELLRDFEMTIFAMVMERPEKMFYEGPAFLQTHHQRLFERIDRFMEREHPEHWAIPIFDGQDPGSNKKLSECFEGFMARSDAGRAMKHIVPSPLFVDSAITPGIQVADLFAYAIRVYYENELHHGAVSDPYLSAIKRYANIVRSKTIDYETESGFVSYGISTMDASKFVYDWSEAKPSSLPEEPPSVPKAPPEG